MKNISKSLSLSAVMLALLVSASASGDVSPKAFRVTNMGGQTERCLNDLRVSNLQPRVGDVVFLYKDADGSLTFTDSSQTEMGSLKYPIGQHVSKSGSNGGAEVKYDASYISTDFLMVNETDSVRQSAKITIDLSKGKIEYSIGTGRLEIGAPFLFSNCTLEEIK